MDCLVALYHDRDKVAPRSELIENVWGVNFGGDESLTRAISILRRTLRELGVQSPTIETIAKRGYRLKLAEHDQAAPGAEQGQIASAGGNAPHDAASAAQPHLQADHAFLPYSVAVEPIDCSACPAEQSLANDIARDLVSMLSRVPSLRVRAFHADPGMRSDSVPRWRQRDDAKYVVSGSLNRNADDLILRIALIDAETDTHILSWRFDIQGNRFKADLDNFILDLSTPILSEIQISEATRAHMLGPDELNTLQREQATDLLRSLYSPQRAAEIIEHLEHVIALDPANAVARTELATQIAQSINSNWISEPVAARARAIDLVATALKLAPDNADVLTGAGATYSLIPDPEKAERYLHRSLVRNPNNPHALAVLGWIRALKGNDREGLEQIRTAERRAPHHPRKSSWIFYRGVVHEKYGRFEKAEAAFSEACDCNPGFSLAHFHRALMLANLGRPDDAVDAAAEGLSIFPQFSPDKFRELSVRFPLSQPESFSSEEVIARLEMVWPDQAQLRTIHRFR